MIQYGARNDGRDCWYHGPVSKSQLLPIKEVLHAAGLDFKLHVLQADDDNYFHKRLLSEIIPFSALASENEQKVTATFIDNMFLIRAVALIIFSVLVACLCNFS